MSVFYSHSGDMRGNNRGRNKNKSPLLGLSWFKEIKITVKACSIFKHKVGGRARDLGNGEAPNRLEPTFPTVQPCRVFRLTLPASDSTPVSNTVFFYVLKSQ